MNSRIHEQKLTKSKKMNKISLEKIAYEFGIGILCIIYIIYILLGKK